MLTTEQQQVLNACVNNPKPITIIQGKAGCGKSFLVRELIRKMDAVILTPTNMAKSVYSQALTFHSFFYGELDDLDEGFQDVPNYKYKNNPWVRNKLSTLKAIIFDEISMVRSDYFEMMNKICQSVKNNNRPFGGIQVILVGDIYQLPPVVEDKDTLKYLEREYGGIYYFNSHVIQNNLQEIRYCELSKSVRQQNDTEFERILDTIRTGSDLNTLLRVVDLLNERVVDEIPNNIITIASSNAEVLRINHKELAKLSGNSRSFPAQFIIKKKNNDEYYSVLYNKSLRLSNQYENIEVPSSYEAELILKEGVKVMYTSSNKRAGYVNGDMGTVVRITNDMVCVKHERSGLVHNLERTQKYRYQMRYDEVKHRLVRSGRYVQKTTQFPIKLAYAFTIHKSQGQTYDNVYFDLESPVFASGQLYVALSRVKSKSGLYLTKPVTVGDIIVDPKIVRFFSRFTGVSENVTIPLCQSFENTSLLELMRSVDLQEIDPSMKKTIKNTTILSDRLLSVNSYKYAALELRKIADVAKSCYDFNGVQNDLFSKIYQLTRFRDNIAKYECQDIISYIRKIYLSLTSDQIKAFTLDPLHCA